MKHGCAVCEILTRWPNDRDTPVIVGVIIGAHFAGNRLTGREVMSTYCQEHAMLFEATNTDANRSWVRQLIESVQRHAHEGPRTLPRLQ